MITLSSMSLGPRAGAAPKWWRPAAQPNWAQLDAQIAEAKRLIAQYPGRRQSAAANQETSPTRKISAAAIYAVRAVHAALPRARARICEQQCHEQADGREACDEIMCRATVRGRLDRARPTPRSIHDVIRDHYRSRA